MNPAVSKIYLQGLVRMRTKPRVERCKVSHEICHRPKKSAVMRLLVHRKQSAGESEVLTLRISFDSQEVT